jgi:hypothetical protein
MLGNLEQKQKRDVGKYSFLNKIIQLRKTSPADVFEIISCSPGKFRETLKK